MKPGISEHLQAIPGVGPSIARDLLDLGYERVADLRRLDASDLIARLLRDFSQRDAQRESLQRNLPGLRQRANEQMDEIAQLLGRASTPLEHAA